MSTCASMTCRLVPRIGLAAVLLTVLSLTALPASAQNVLVNGGFEAPVVPAGSYEWFDDIPGWSTTGVSLMVARYYAAATGQQFVRPGYAPSTIVQHVATTPSGVYHIRFAYSPRPSYADNRIRVLWNGEPVALLDRSGVGLLDTSWEYSEFDVVATSTISSLAFEAVGAPYSISGFLDDVSLELTDHAAAPRFTPDEGVFSNVVTVTLTTASPDATIYYTIDGSTPDTSSPSTPSGGQVVVDQTATLIQAFTSAPGQPDSPVIQAQYTLATVAPIFDPVYATTPAIITLTSATDGADIHYTLDGSDPLSGAGILYTGPVELAGTVTLSAAATKPGFEPSPVVTRLYNPSGIVHHVANIPFDGEMPIDLDFDGNMDVYIGVYPGGGYMVAEVVGTWLGGWYYYTPWVDALEPGFVVGPDAQFVYCGNGGCPNLFSSDLGMWAEPGFVGMAGVRFYGSDGELRYAWIQLLMPDGQADPGAVIDWAFAGVPNVPIAVGDTASGILPPPRATPPAGTYENALTVTLTSFSSDATIFYTIDGSTPDHTSASMPSGGQIELTHTGVVIRAFAVAPEREDSPVVDFAYTLLVAHPEFDPPYAVTPVTVALASAQDGAAVYYTLDGSDPLSKAGIPYTGPLDLTGTVTVTAGALKDGFEPSRLTTRTFQPPTVVFVDPVDILCAPGTAVWLDLDFNGAVDVEVFNSIDAGWSVGCYGDPALNASTDVVSQLTPGTFVSPALRFHDEFMYPTFYLFIDGQVEGEWKPDQVGVLGLRFPDSDGLLHYGWLRLRMPASPADPVVVLDWAFDTTAGVPIKAGEAAPVCPPTFVAHSTSVPPHTGEPMELMALASGEVSYRWLHDGAQLFDDARISGSTTSTLRIADTRSTDSGAYEAIATSDCGEATSETTIVNISPLCPPFNGYAVRFEGSAWIVVFDQPLLDIRETGTLEAWFFAESDQWRADLIRKSDGLYSDSNRAYETAYDGSVSVSFFIGPQGTSATVSLRSAPALAEQWHHFAATIDTNAGVARLFIDGRLDSETTVLTDGTPIPHLPVRNSSYPVFIGGRPPLFNSGAGAIDEVRLWNIARSPDEIAAGYRDPIDPASPGLVAYYRLDEGTGTTADNAAGPDLNGGLRGSATWTPTVSCCITDVNADGVVNSTDVSAFINLWFEDQSAGTLQADWDGNGVVNSTDVAEFINAWFEDVAGGCG